MSEFFSNFSKKYFSGNVYEKFENFQIFGGNFQIFFHRKKSGEDITCEKNCIFSRTFFRRKKSENFPQKSENFIKIPRKIFFVKVGKKIGRQDRSKILLRIEWNHSQPLKTTLKHSYGRNTYFFMIFVQNP